MLSDYSKPSRELNRDVQEFYKRVTGAEIRNQARAGHAFGAHAKDWPRSQWLSAMSNITLTDDFIWEEKKSATWMTYPPTPPKQQRSLSHFISKNFLRIHYYARIQKHFNKDAQDMILPPDPEKPRVDRQGLPNFLMKLKLPDNTTTFLSLWILATYFTWKIF